MALPPNTICFVEYIPFIHQFWGTLKHFLYIVFCTYCPSHHTFSYRTSLYYFPNCPIRLSAKTYKVIAI